MKIDWSKLAIGTKVRYKASLYRCEMKNGYFAGIFEPTGCIKVSRIDKDIEFTNTKMDSYSVCEYVKIEDVELFE